MIIFFYALFGVYLQNSIFLRLDWKEVKYKLILIWNFISPSKSYCIINHIKNIYRKPKKRAPLTISTPNLWRKNPLSLTHASYLRVDCFLSSSTSFTLLYLKIGSFFTSFRISGSGYLIFEWLKKSFCGGVGLGVLLMKTFDVLCYFLVDS